MADPQQHSLSAPQTNKKWTIFHRHKISNGDAKFLSLSPTVEIKDEPLFVTEIRILKSGYSAKKRRTLILKPLRIEFVKANGEDKRELILSDISSLKYDDKTNAVVFKGSGYVEKSLFIQAGLVEDTAQGIPTSSTSTPPHPAPSSSSSSLSSENENYMRDEALKLLLCVNSVRAKFFGYLPSCVAVSEKERALGKVYCERYTGGIVKRDGEEWFYDAKQKVVKSDIGVEPQLSFDWDGFHLRPRDEASSAMGTGVWDGFQLRFACPTAESAHSLGHSNSVSIVRNSKVMEAPEPGHSRSRSKTSTITRSGSVDGQCTLTGISDGLGKESSLGLDDEDSSSSFSSSGSKSQPKASTKSRRPTVSGHEAVVNNNNTNNNGKEKKKGKEKGDFGMPPLKSRATLPKSFAFTFSANLNRYLLDSDREEKHSWQWTRHFLKRVKGEGEWIVEGSVPEPVVMFLQILRWIRFKDEF